MERVSVKAWDYWGTALMCEFLVSRKSLRKTCERFCSTVSCFEFCPMTTTAFQLIVYISGPQWGVLIDAYILCI